MSSNRETGNLLARASAAILAALGMTAALAEGDIAKGEAYFNKACLTCHAPGHSGPPYTGLVGRKAGTVQGFGYSQALRNSNIVWSEETLDAWLRSPNELVPGNIMGISVRDPVSRANLVAYLKTRR
jgi:cytochrome c